MEMHLRLRRFCLKQGSNRRPLDQLAIAKPTELPGFLHYSEGSQHVFVNNQEESALNYL